VFDFWGLSSATAIHCLFAHNQAPVGAAVNFWTGGTTGGSLLDRCTVVGHSTDCISASGVRIRNSILYANALPHVSPGGVAPTISYSDVQGGAPGIGNFDLDPQFIDPTADDYHLRFGSPCVDAGDPASAGFAADFDGDPGKQGANVDCGADEFHPHLYAAGDFTPGGTATVTVVGPPAPSPALLFLGFSEQDPGIPSPFGTFLVAPPFFQLPLGPLPPSGFLKLTGVIPPSAPSMTVYKQAFTGGVLTNLCTPDVW
jgi:hypothetical protein